uniref:Uncharacterized protein n=1 Tax=Solanum lycopersicum TaxID=4081 RepID=A0A3Q7EFD1_SOLLC
MNYYLPCPNPSITTGARRQCDGGGLYVRGNEGDKWIHIIYSKVTLAFNIVVDLSMAPISVQLFVNAILDNVIGPFPQMLKDGEK